MEQSETNRNIGKTKKFGLTFYRNPDEYTTRISINNKRGDTVVNTPIEAENGLLDHLEEVKDVLGRYAKHFYETQ